MPATPHPATSPLPLVAVTVVAGPGPVTFRLPENGEVDPHFGLARTAWAALIRCSPHGPCVKSFLCKWPGAVRGARLIDYASARAYIERQKISTGGASRTGDQDEPDSVPSVSSCST